VHLNILKPDALAKEDFFAKCHHVSKFIFDIVAAYHGSISAEHGVGLLKKDFLGHSRSAEEIVPMKQIKKVFDPNGVMNPGKIFD
jgi:FAD/FMN-containing dehydrogenase